MTYDVSEQLLEQFVNEVAELASRSDQNLKDIINQDIGLQGMDWDVHSNYEHFAFMLITGIATHELAKRKVI